MMYTVLAHEETVLRAQAYLERILAGEEPGAHLAYRLEGKARESVDDLLGALLHTKEPQIFAESSVCGNGSDWTREELAILGDLAISAPVTVFDNGRHRDPDIHDEPFPATLVFVPGALLRNGTGHPAADWDAVTSDFEIDPEAYFALYERRLLPCFHHVDRIGRQADRPVLLTVPGLGCGQFAGPFRGALGAHLRDVLARLLEQHGARFPSLDVVYYDPYDECDSERRRIGEIDFMVRPLRRRNAHRPQLCRPERYADPGDDFADHLLASLVAWDHVSWPGNDFYIGARATDDGVKAAATDVMTAITGIEGRYDHDRTAYQPPKPYRTWGELVEAEEITLELKDNLEVVGP